MRTKIKTLLVTMAACLLGFTGCSSVIKEGTIVDKDYKPEHHIYTWNGRCVIRTHFPDKYIFTIEDEIEGESQQNRIEVSCEDYYLYEVGDCYSTEN